MKLTRAQRTILRRMEKGEELREYLIPDRRKSFYRTFGPVIPGAELVYEIGGDLVRYPTFRVLFKRNLINPINPEWRRPCTPFELTPAGHRALEGEKEKS